MSRNEEFMAALKVLEGATVHRVEDRGLDGVKVHYRANSQPSMEAVVMADAALVFVVASHADAIQPDYPEHTARKLTEVAEWLRGLAAEAAAGDEWVELLATQWKGMPVLQVSFATDSLADVQEPAVRDEVSVLRSALSAYRSALRCGERESEQLRELGDNALAVSGAG